MSRLKSQTQIDTSSPETLRRDLARALATIDELFDLTAALFGVEWNSVTPLQRGDIRAKFGELVRVDTTPGRAVPRVYLPEAKTTDIGKRIGITRNHLSPTCMPIIYPANNQLLRYAVTGLTITASTLNVRELVWTGASWEGGY